MPIPDVVFGLGAHSTVAERAELLDLVTLADRGGLDLVSLSDHPYLGDRLDAYATLAFLLGRTERIAAMANVTNLPTRPAPMLARTVTTLSALADGRVVLGLGAGGRWDRIADMGVAPLPAAQAVDAFEEAMVLTRRLAGGGPPVTFHGRHLRVDGIAPAPVAAPPIWTGSVGPRSLDATGRAADGWIPGHAADWRSERYRSGRERIDAAAVAAGRDPAAVRTVFNLPGRITDTPLAETRDDAGRWIGGSSAQWADELAGAVHEHGASGFILFSPTGGSPDAPTLRRWTDEVVPAVRAALRSTTPSPVG